MPAHHSLRREAGATFCHRVHEIDCGVSPIDLPVEGGGHTHIGETLTLAVKEMYLRLQRC